MYRIELRIGEEAIYKTFDEFARAVQTGVINSHARVWHGASEKWLPISFHPHFKRAQTAQLAPVSAPTPPAQSQAAAPAPQPAPAPVPVAQAPVPATPEPGRPVAPAPLPRTSELEFLEVPELLPHAPRAVAGSLFGPPAAPAPSHIQALVAAADQLPHVPEVADAEDEHEILIDIGSSRKSARRRTVAIAAGVLLVAGAAGGVMLLRPTSKTAENATDTTPAMASTSLAATPSNSFVINAPAVDSGARRPGASQPAQSSYMDMPTIPEGRANPVAARSTEDSSKVLPAAPRIGGLDNGAIGASGTSAAALGARYNAAHDAALSALESRLRASGVTALFSESRLASDKVSDTRLAVSGIANFIRSYRTNDAAIETAYRDSALQLASAWKLADEATWKKVAVRAEDRDAARSADQLLSDISSLLGVLEEQAGGYTIQDGKVTFRDAGATLRYGTLRRRVSDRLAAGDSGSSVLVAFRHVIGSALPPVEAYEE